MPSFETVVIALVCVAVLSAVVAGVMSWQKSRKVKRLGRMVDEIAKGSRNPLTFENDEPEQEADRT